jgi:hypothetical protein
VRDINFVSLSTAKVENEKPYANVTVHDQGDTQEAVDDGVSGAAGNERGTGDGEERGGEEPFERPVVRSMALVRWRESRRIVHRSLENGCTSSNDPRAKTKQALSSREQKGPHEKFVSNPYQNILGDKRLLEKGGDSRPPGTYLNSPSS